MGLFEIFQHSFCRKTPKNWRGTLWGIHFFSEIKSRNAEKTKRGDPLVSSGIVCYAGNLFESVLWANSGNLKFCRTFGRTILVASGVSKNKPRTAKVCAISKAQNCKKWDPSGFVELQLVAKYEKIWRGTLWGLEKISQKSVKKWDFWTVSQCRKM